MDNIHGTHRPSGIIKHPFLLQIQVIPRSRLIEFGDDMIDHTPGVITMSRNRALRQLVQLIRSEDVELVQARIEVGVCRGEEGQDEAQDAEGAHGEAGTAGFGLGGGFGGHG